MPQEKDQVLGAKIGKLRDVHEAWTTKNPINPGTGQRPVFRIAIGLSPKTLPRGEDPETAKHKDKENWGALMDAVVQFAQELTGNDCCLMSSIPDEDFAKNVLRSTYAFTTDKMFYCSDCKIEEIKITTEKLSKLKGALGITDSDRDKKPEKLSHKRLRNITSISGHVPSARNLQPIEVNIISAYGKLAAIQKQGEEELKGTPLSFKEASDISTAVGKAWKREYYDPLFAQHGSLLSIASLEQLGLDIEFKMVYWDEFVARLKLLELEAKQLDALFGDPKLPKCWYETDTSYKYEVDKTRDDFVYRTLRRLDIAKPSEPGDAKQDSPEYKTYLEKNVAYLARIKKFEEATVSYILREAGPLTIGLIHSGISAILYPGDTLKVEAPAALAATFEKYKKEGIFTDASSEQMTWNWCSYTTTLFSSKNIGENVIARAFRDDKVLPQKPSPPPSPSRSYPGLFGRRDSDHLTRRPISPINIQDKSVSEPSSPTGASPTESPAVILSMLQKMREEWQKEKEDERAQIEAKVEAKVEAMLNKFLQAGTGKPLASFHDQLFLGQEINKTSSMLPVAAPPLQPRC